MLQEILVFICFGLAVGFMIKKFFWSGSKKKKAAKNCGSNNCGCG
ncbi:MAG: FeoB-associated Cys-rich membrane protein [Mesonia hippocampi]|nr:FeoB-associated Cys-rich membrane protein [Mesonia hippocampi]